METEFQRDCGFLLTTTSLFPSLSLYLSLGLWVFVHEPKIYSTNNNNSPTRNMRVDSHTTSSVLLIHLNLAKYAGPAACYPPTRDVCDTLFDKADTDNSGGISQEELGSWRQSHGNLYVTYLQGCQAPNNTNPKTA